MFLEILDNLMNERGLNKHSLSKQSGIPYTTIDGFYKKGCENVKLPTLRQLAEFFNVSLDYLVGEAGEQPQSLSFSEQELLKRFRRLSKIGQRKAEDYIRLLSLDETTRKAVSTIAENTAHSNAEMVAYDLDDMVHTEWGPKKPETTAD